MVIKKLITNEIYNIHLTFVRKYLFKRVRRMEIIPEILKNIAGVSRLLCLT